MNIYVGDLSLDVTEAELRQLFTTFGEVLAVILMNDKHIGSGRSLGYGYVEMALKSDGQNAVNELQQQKLRGQLIKVVEALPLSNNKPDRTFPSKKGKYLNTRTKHR